MNSFSKPNKPGFMGTTFNTKNFSVTLTANLLNRLKSNLTFARALTLNLQFCLKDRHLLTQSPNMGLRAKIRKSDRLFNFDQYWEHLV